MNLYKENELCGPFDFSHADFEICALEKPSVRPRNRQEEDNPAKSIRSYRNGQESDNLCGRRYNWDTNARNKEHNVDTTYHFGSLHHLLLMSVGPCNHNSLLHSS